MRVVAFTGMPGAGKTEAVAVAKARGFPVVRMGEFVWEETKRRGLELADANVGRVATEMRAKNGPDYWARLTCDRILTAFVQEPLVVVDGVRNYEEVDTFRRRLGDRFELVAVEAAREVRVDRLMQRKREDDPGVKDQILHRDERELGWGIGKSIEKADHRLVNEGDLVVFRRLVSELLDRLVQ